MPQVAVGRSAKPLHGTEDLRGISPGIHCTALGLAFPQRPDFVGMDANHFWIVVESKGRSGGITNAILDSAKRQVRSLRSISGELPALRIAVATYFSKSRLRARVCDPAMPGPRAVDIALTEEQLARAYYRPVVEMIQASGLPLSRREVDGRAEVVVRLGQLDATLVLEERILSWYLKGRPNWAAIMDERRSDGSVLYELEVLGKLAEKSGGSKLRDDGGSLDMVLAARLQQIKNVGDDGVAVELGSSWDREHMRQEPEHRTHQNPRG